VTRSAGSSSAVASIDETKRLTRLIRYVIQTFCSQIFRYIHDHCLSITELNYFPAMMPRVWPLWPGCDTFSRAMTTNSFGHCLCWLALRRSAFTCVGWQVTLCDPIRQVTPRSLRTSSRRGLYSALTFFNITVYTNQHATCVLSIGNRFNCERSAANKMLQIVLRFPIRDLALDTTG